MACLLCMQGTPLPSADGASVLVLGSDGNLVLYNTLAQKLYGNSFASAIFASGTSGRGTAPYSLVMQNVRPSHTPRLKGHAYLRQPQGLTACCWTTGLQPGRV